LSNKNARFFPGLPGSGFRLEGVRGAMMAMKGSLQGCLTHRQANFFQKGEFFS